MPIRKFEHVTQRNPWIDGFKKSGHYSKLHIAAFNIQCFYICLYYITSTCIIVIIYIFIYYITSTCVQIKLRKIIVAIKVKSYSFKKGTTTEKKQDNI